MCSDIMIMIKHKDFICKFVRRRCGSCALLLDSKTASVDSSSSQISLKDTCFSLVDQLIFRGSVSSAQKVIQRLISQCSSITEVMSAVNFSSERNISLDLVSCGCLIRKLVIFGDLLMAEGLYMDCVIGKCLEPDRELLNSMIICYSKLGKLNEAKSCFDRLVQRECLPWVGACNAIIKSFSVRNRILESYDFFVQTCKVSDIVLDFSCYNRLVNGLCCRGFLEEGLHVFDVMLDRGVPPTVNLCKSMLVSFCKWGRVEEAEVLSTEIESHGFFMDKITFTYLIHAYCKERKMKMAMRLFFRMLKMGCEPDTYTYNTLIHGFLNLGLISKGWLLHKMMLASGLKPNLVTYQIVLQKYCMDQKVDNALTLLNDMLQNNIDPNVHCYTVLIATLFKEKRFEEAYSLFHKMLNNRVGPDHVLFFTLVKNLTDGDEMFWALAFLKAIMVESDYNNAQVIFGSEKPKSITDAMFEIENLLEHITTNYDIHANTAFSIYIIALCVGGRLDAALCCMERMVNLGFLPFHTAFNSLLKLLFQKGLVEDAQYIIEVMQDQGIVPNQTTFSIIVNEHCKQGDFSSALDVLDQIQERGIRPSVAIYNSIIDCLGRQKMIYEAEKVFYKMLDSGVDPDETIFVTMINAYSRNGLANLANELFEKMIEYNFRPSSHAYTTLIAGLVKKNMILKSCRYLDKMLKEGLMPNTVLYTSLIKQFLRKREFEFSFRLYDLMEKSKIEQDLVTYITLISGICRSFRYYEANWFLSDNKSKKAKELLFQLLHLNSGMQMTSDSKILMSSNKEIKFFALQLIQKIKQIPILPDLYLLNSKILGLCREQMMKEAYDHLNLMQREGVQPNMVTFTILIDGHMKIGEVDLAVGLFNKLNANGFAPHGPDGILLNTLVKGLCKFGRIVDALSLSHNMQKRGFFPSKVSYEMLLSSLCAQQSSISALKIYEDMLAHGYFPCSYNRDWLIYLLCKDNKLKDVSTVYASMVNKRNPGRMMMTG